MTALRYLLDTNICIYIQKHRSPALLARFRKLKSGEAAISVITWGELRFGARKSQDSSAANDALDALIGLIPVLPMSAGVGDAYGEIRATLESEGRPIGNNDLWIAAQAKSEGLTLVTNNLREFERVPQLKVENWA